MDQRQKVLTQIGPGIDFLVPVQRRTRGDQSNFLYLRRLYRCLITKPWSNCGACGLAAWPPPLPNNSNNQSCRLFPSKNASLYCSIVNSTCGRTAVSTASYNWPACVNQLVSKTSTT